MADPWGNDEPVSDLGIDVPPWIEQDITPYDVAAICQGGCASGAYMPAVTYYQAIRTMGEHGDNILDYIRDGVGEIMWPSLDESWGSMACYFVSLAVELWAMNVEDEISDALNALDDDNEQE